MVKGRRLLAVLMVGAAILSGCGQTADAVMKDEIQTKDNLTEESTLIYYGNQAADGLAAEEITFEALTQDRLLKELTRRNIVSMDTKVQSLEKKEEEGKTVLYLDLSKQFGEYVGLMGENGEYIVIAALTNTFLDAYDAIQMILTVDGEVLKTAHAVYEKPFTFFPMEEEKNASAYTWTEEVILTDTADIKYLQFAGMEDKNRMDKWNRLIAERSTGDYQNQTIKNYTADYEITAENAGVVSMIIRGSYYYEDTAYPIAFKHTFNFDLTSGNNLRLKDYIKIEKAALCLQKGTGFTVLQEGVQPEDLALYLESDNLEDYYKLLENYDYDFENKNIIPTGYSYMKENEVVLVMEVPHALGDAIEVMFDAKEVQ